MSESKEPVYCIPESDRELACELIERLRGHCESNFKRFDRESKSLREITEELRALVRVYYERICNFTRELAKAKHEQTKKVGEYAVKFIKILSAEVVIARNAELEARLVQKNADAVLDGLKGVPVEDKVNYVKAVDLGVISADGSDGMAETNKNMAKVFAGFPEEQRSRIGKLLAEWSDEKRSKKRKRRKGMNSGKKKIHKTNDDEA
jgi:hypothetical protein